MKFDHIFWKDTAKVKGLFSLKNPEFATDNLIPGLNLGYNTPEDNKVVEQNRNLWFEAAGINPELTAWGIQVHQTRVANVDEPGVHPETDGLVTGKKGMSLAIFVADCAAVLLADESKQVIGACHAGWKGAAGRIVGKTVRAMQNLGADPGKITAFISPCISQQSFEVGQEVAIQFPGKFVDRSRPKPHVDLEGFVKAELIKAGVPEPEITISGGCTMQEASRFYSYRREGAKSGRMMALIHLKK